MRATVPRGILLRIKVDAQCDKLTVDRRRYVVNLCPDSTRRAQPDFVGDPGLRQVRRVRAGFRQSRRTLSCRVRVRVVDSGVDPGGVRGAIAPASNKKYTWARVSFRPLKVLAELQKIAPRLHHKSPF